MRVAKQQVQVQTPAPAQKSANMQVVTVTEKKLTKKEMRELVYQCVDAIMSEVRNSTHHLQSMAGPISKICLEFFSDVPIGEHRLSAFEMLQIKEDGVVLRSKEYVFFMDSQVISCVPILSQNTAKFRRMTAPGYRLTDTDFWSVLKDFRKNLSNW